jgi:hypothetical protein
VAVEPEAAGVELVGMRGDVDDEDGADGPVGEAVLAEDVAGLGAGEEAVTHGVKGGLFVEVRFEVMPRSAELLKPGLVCRRGWRCRDAAGVEFLPFAGQIVVCQPLNGSKDGGVSLPS